MATQSANEALVRRLYEHFSKGEIEHILSHITPGCPWISHADPVASSFPPAAATNAPEFFRRFAEITTTLFLPKEFFSGVDHVTVIGEYKFKHNAQNRHFGGTFVHVWILKEAKVVRLEQWVDYRTL